MKVQPVILAGGSGTRLWPLSREYYPKPLLPLGAQRPLIQEAICRLLNQWVLRPMAVAYPQPAWHQRHGFTYPARALNNRETLDEARRQAGCGYASAMGRTRLSRVPLDPVVRDPF